MAATSPRRRSLASGLHNAIETGAMVVHYQPKARIGSGAIIGLEALVRWAHPTLGLVGPAEFVGIAEQTGQIGVLTAAVLRQATMQCASWRAEGHDVSISVNISARSLRDDLLTTRVAEAIDDAGLPADALTLEIAEASVMAHAALAVEVLNRLASLGVHLSIDDFGTGYSSLSYLQQLPVDEVKVDRTFVEGMTKRHGDLVVVRLILDLARNLGLRVVAEGVEDSETWARLAGLACDEAQGYFIAQPMPAATTERWLRAQRSVRARAAL